MKSLERTNEDLWDEIAIRDKTIELLQSNIKQIQVEHSRAMKNKDNEHRKTLEGRGGDIKRRPTSTDYMFFLLTPASKERRCIGSFFSNINTSSTKSGTLSVNSECFDILSRVVK